ncbi:MAG: hypothetical protein Q7T16_06645 [Candidatus Burarchaeum sp.]|nr:hypothetical protein [Candidatus Burarchaeum sp.]MDO8340306.1 hypothetical protein [Candidatus Burarchaeum sp.]
MGDTYERLKRVIATCRPVFACESDTPGDRSLMKMYSDAGCRALIGFRLPSQRFDWVAHVESGFFSQIMFPEKFHMNLRKIYQKGDAGSNTSEILSLLHEPAKITVIITHNRELALKYREKILAKLDKKRK